MRKLSKLACLCAVLVMLVSVAYAEDVFPTVDFAFDGVDEYSWTVNYTADVNVIFTYIQVYSKIPALSWTSVSGAWSGTPEVDEGWLFTYPTNGDGVALRWHGGSEHQRLPSGGAWTGTFKIRVPGSEPVPGNLRVFSSATKYSLQTTMVPAMVPEPSSIAALGSLFGLMPLMLRRKRK